MKYLISTAAIGLSAFALSSVSAPTPALAACGPVCVAKCKATASDVQHCIERWAILNESPTLAREQEAAFYRNHPEVNKSAYRKFLPKKQQ